MIHANGTYRVQRVQSEETQLSHLLESALTQASTQECDPRSSQCRKLSLRAGPIVRHRTAITRNLAKVDRQTFEALELLTAGKAPWPLFLWGPAGVGKTCAALCVLDFLGGHNSYQCVAELRQDFADAQQERLFQHGRQITPEMVWRSVEAAILAVLDELGSNAKVSEHHYDCVKRHIDLRTNKPAIYISNLSLEDLERVYDDRIASRLASGTVVEMTGIDRRVA